MLPFVFEDGMGFERYVDYALDVPMYFLYRGGDYLDVSGLSFRDLMAGKLKGYEGELPTMTDWENHLTTIFPEVNILVHVLLSGIFAAAIGCVFGLPSLRIKGPAMAIGAEDAAFGIEVALLQGNPHGHRPGERHSTRRRRPETAPRQQRTELA